MFYSFRVQFFVVTAVVFSFIISISGGYCLVHDNANITEMGDTSVYNKMFRQAAVYQIALYQKSC